MGKGKILGAESAMDKAELYYYPELEQFCIDEMHRKFLQELKSDLFSGDDKIYRASDIRSSENLYKNQIVLHQRIYVDDLVRCGKCKYCLTIEEKEVWDAIIVNKITMYCQNIDSALKIISENDFCSKGERVDDDKKTG